MENTKSIRKTNKKILYAGILLLVCLAAAGILIFVRHMPKELRKDIDGFKEGDYDTLFVSMYDISCFQEEEFAYFRGLNLYKSSVSFTDIKTMQRYFKELSKDSSAIAGLSTVYLGIMPEKTDRDAIYQLAANFPNISFEVFLPAPSSTYWSSLSRSEFDIISSSYADYLCNAFPGENIRFYSFTHLEWMTMNPSLHVDALAPAIDAASFMMLHGDYTNPYMICPETSALISDEFSALMAKLQTQPFDFPNLSDTEIVFFGDSVIGNYTNDCSVPGFVSGLSSASVYNCGFGGTCASPGTENIISFPEVAEAFIHKDFSKIPTTSQLYNGLTEYLNANSHKEHLIFVVNFGLNDYFYGHIPAASQNRSASPDGSTEFETTYREALAEGCRLLLSARPDSTIYICTPTYTEVTTEASLAAGYELSNYVDAVLSLGQEMNLPVIDNYKYSGIDSSNSVYYLGDSIHPNERGRYLIALNILQELR